MNTDAMKAKLTVVKILIDELAAELEIHEAVEIVRQELQAEPIRPPILLSDMVGPDVPVAPIPDRPATPKAEQSVVAIDWETAKPTSHLPIGTHFNAALLRQQRAREQLGQDRMAAKMEEMGIPVAGPTISQLETGGTQRPQLNTVMNIARFFTISPDRYVVTNS